MATAGQQTPIIRKLMDILARRKVKNNLRFPDDLAARTQPLPVLPNGPSHKLNTNYYYSRDGRRDATPPVAVFTGQKKIVGQAGEPKALRIPGFGYNYGDGQGAFTKSSKS